MCTLYYVLREACSPPKFCSFATAYKTTVVLEQLVFSVGVNLISSGSTCRGELIMLCLRNSGACF